MRFSDGPNAKQNARRRCERSWQVREGFTEGGWCRFVPDAVGGPISSDAGSTVNPAEQLASELISSARVGSDFDAYVAERRASIRAGARRGPLGRFRLRD
ncbi:MAG: hypothetical protein ACK53W_12475 [Gemmatimonadota bacterium]